jgi:hypothetical protein
MDTTLRVLLIIGSIVTTYSILHKIRQSTLKIEDSLFWLMLSLSLVIISLFPRIVYVLSGLLGFESASNFVFVIIIFLLITKLFSVSVKMSSLNHKFNMLVQIIALNDSKERLHRQSMQKDDV